MCAHAHVSIAHRAFLRSEEALVIEQAVISEQLRAVQKLVRFRQIHLRRQYTTKSGTDKRLRCTKGTTKASDSRFHGVGERGETVHKARCDMIWSNSRQRAHKRANMLAANITARSLCMVRLRRPMT